MSLALGAPLRLQFVSVRPLRGIRQTPADCVPLRLTARGIAVLAGVVTAALFALLWLVAPAPDPVAPASPAAVTVGSGDTLWSIAQSIAPGSDSRDVVARLIRINGLYSVDLQPGQVLRTR